MGSDTKGALNQTFVYSRYKKAIAAWYRTGSQQSFSYLDVSGYFVNVFFVLCLC